ncbi:MAG: hypothetical protein ACREHD_05145 [Pirellulales bacterium]
MPVPSLCQGRIIWSDVADRLGNVKRRPVVIVTPDDDIKTAAELIGVVCSTTSAYVQPRPADYIEVPHHPTGNCRTKLRKATVAVCRWTVELSKELLLALDEEDYAGVIPPRTLKSIIEAM